MAMPMSTLTTFPDIQFSLSCESRIAILLRLAIGELAAAKLAAALEFSPPHLSNHLRVLRHAKLVAFTQRRNSRFYALSEFVTVIRSESWTKVVARAEDGSSLRVLLPGIAIAAGSISNGLCPRGTTAGGSGLQPT
jgi:DNA-binding transcriptional ArsR family regulator